MWVQSPRLLVTCSPQSARRVGQTSASHLLLYLLQQAREAHRGRNTLMTTLTQMCMRTGTPNPEEAQENTVS